MGQTATNPETGEHVYFDAATNSWLPAKTATNPETGATVIFDGTGWQPLSPPAATPAAPVPPVTAAPPVPSPAAPAAPPPEIFDPMSGAPIGVTPPPGTPTGAALGRQQKLDLQAVGSGLTGAAMFPLDAPVLLGKGANWAGEKLFQGVGAGANAVSQYFGGPDLSYTPRAEKYAQMGIPDPATTGIPSEEVKHGVSLAAQKLGYDPATPETPGERLRSNVIDLAANAGGGGLALTRAAASRAKALTEPGALPSIFDKFVQPYFTNPAKTVAGDVGAGATAGAALTGSQEYLPKDIRDTLGGWTGTGADLAAMLVGGVSGGRLASSLLNTPTTIPRAVRGRMAAGDIAVDPITKLPVTNRAADEAANLIQSMTTAEPMSVAKGIEQRIKDFKDQNLPLPTTGLVADDLGLAGLEKTIRTRRGPGGTQLDPNAPPEVREQFSFGARDQALRDAAAENVQSIRQPGADPTIFPQRAEDVAAMRLEQAQRGVEQPAGQARGVQTAREAPATDVMTSVGQTPGASSNIFDVYANTRTLERERSQGLYSRPEWTQASIHVEPLEDAVAELRANATTAAPITPRAEALMQRIEAAAEEGGGRLSGREISTLNKDIESEIKLALRDGQDFQQLKALKDGIAQTVTQLPGGSAPARAIDAARTNVREVIAPNFRVGTGGSLDMRLKTNPGQVRPETAGAEFLNRGQDTEQLMRIAGLRGNAQEVATNARAIVFDQLAQAGVVKNGVIDPERLALWRNKRANIIDNIPGLGDEINGMIAGARQGAGKASQYAEEIAAAEARLAQTQKDVTQGPLGMVAGKDPRRAVGSILASDNPARNMAELKRQMGNNPAANESLKAAVTDHFLDKVKTLDPHGDTEFGVKLNTLMKEFEKNREVLATVLNPDEMQALQRAQTVLKPLTKRNVQATVGSTTAESTEAAMRPLELALKGWYGILKGGGVFRTVKVAMKTLQGNTADTVEQLVTRAMFDPELAATLLTRDTAKVGTPSWNAELQKLIRRNVAAKALATDENTQPNAPP